MIRALCLLLLLPLPGQAEQVVAALSQDRVSISSNFDGSEIIVFGAIKREAPAPRGAPLAVVVTVEGPDQAVIVRRMDRRFGIWVNVEGVDVPQAPSFYAVATSVALDQALSEEADEQYRVSPRLAVEKAGDSDRLPNEFLEALIRVRADEGRYVLAEEAVALRDDTLFSTTIRLPANLLEGNYETRIFLTRAGEVIDSYGTSIFVGKVGLERLIYSLAHERPLIYGLLSLFIAIAAGWGASAVFRLAQR